MDTREKVRERRSGLRPEKELLARSVTKIPLIVMMMMMMIIYSEVAEQFIPH
jgi:hypothetical protein